ncbi:MAG TPA: hypothetical protein VF194_16370 [Ferrovibrio sp.]|uniref:hypothetical protein n=1 Tax=Ferrovibrio sp. TaxID=1917215 RepID=UPI002ED57D33
MAGLTASARADEFLPRDIPALKRFSIVAGTANNQCLTAQLIRDDVKRVRPMVLLSACEFSIENQTQGFFISRPLQGGYQIFFAANPAYCLAMEPQSHMLVISACAVDTAMLRQLPQLWDLKSGGLSLRDSDGTKWCLDTRNKQGLSAVFEPFLAACPTINPDAFILRVNR